MILPPGGLLFATIASGQASAFRLRGVVIHSLSQYGVAVGALVHVDGKLSHGLAWCGR